MRCRCFAHPPCFVSCLDGDALVGLMEKGKKGVFLERDGGVADRLRTDQFLFLFDVRVNCSDSVDLETMHMKPCYFDQRSHLKASCMARCPQRLR